MVIYVCFLDNDCFNAKDEKLTMCLNTKRQDKIKKYRFDIDKKLCLYSALTLQKHLEQYYHLKRDKILLEEQSYGKPYLPSNPDIHFNLSHTRNAFLCGFSDYEIGVDIEKVQTPPFEIMKKCYTAKEISYILESKEEEQPYKFYDIWTKKESYVKWNGNGITSQLNKIETLDMVNNPDIFTEQINDYSFSICHSDNMKKDSIVQITENELIEYFER